MSIQIIQRYYAEVEKIKRYSGASNESSLRKPFQDLLEQYARARGLVVVAEVEMESKKGARIRPDGVLKDALRQDWGYWESKDEKDDIEAEIKAKFNKGYPNFNILFEDTNTAILYQGGERILEAAFSDAKSLDALLSRFVGYEPKEVSEFHKAIELFSAEVGGLAEVLRAVISEQLEVNGEFSEALNQFLELAQKAINPKIELADVREMIIQHVLTEDIFMRVFDEAEFHRENVIAQKLAEVSGTFYKGDTKKNILARIKPYYETINARASQISDHHEKQKFLKALYESFYKAYNPKAADRLGIVYTPDEIVHFMIESADHLTYKYFGKTLGDKGVEILDPATGTGTFITELIEYLPANQLEYKYDHELHCNEVSILPYYIANLNIEYTYKQKMGKFNEFENICFVDTLDNMGFEHTGKQMNFFGLTDENSERIAKQNAKPIMLVIGNPPYSAWQENYNNQNANRQYPEIDKRIKETYIKQGTAQSQIAVYDMYTRFLRWSSDRVDKNGIIAFVSNNSFLDSRAYDGFRKVVTKEFNEIYIVNLKGNARTSGERRKQESGNVFDDEIKVGIAIYFLVRKEGQKGCRIFYNEIEDYTTSQNKRAFLRESRLSELSFTTLHPDSKNNWLNTTSNDWDELMPMGGEQKAIFDLYSNGVKTQRDEWVYDFSKSALAERINYFADIYQKTLQDENFDGKLKIKWDADLENYRKRSLDISFDNNKIVESHYRPFVKIYLYFDKKLNGRTYQNIPIFADGNAENVVIAVNGRNGSQWTTFVSNKIVDLNALYGGAQCFPLYRYIPRPDRSSSAPESGESTARKKTQVGQDDSGDLSGLNPSGLERVENITDWALAQFKRKYEDGRMKDEKKSKKDSSFITHPSSLTKEDIFHYVYAVLHHPAYRAKYEINLKREFPRIPFYEDFHQWAGWGKRLMELHLNYETVNPYPLQTSEVSKTSEVLPTTRLIARKEKGEIEIDSQTTLKGVPAEAWDYRLGTYSALEWVLERYKEKKPKDPTIAEKFNTYRFADYKEQVIELLKKVCAVSVETMKITKEMP